MATAAGLGGIATLTAEDAIGKAFVFVIVGGTSSVFLTPAGVSIAGNGAGANGSYGHALAGSLAGSLVTFGSLFAFENDLLIATLAIAPVLQIGGSILVFELAADPRSRRASTTTPAIAVRPNATGGVSAMISGAF